MMMKRIIILLVLACSAWGVRAQCGAENDAIKPGEDLTYELKFNWKFIWVNAGQARMRVTEDTFRGKPCLNTTLLSVSNKKVDFFFKMRDTLTCMTSQLLEPLYFRKAAEEGKRFTIDEAWFSYADGRSNVHQRRTWIKPEREPYEMDYSDERCIFDMLSILAQARSYRAEDYQVGDKIHFPMATGRRVDPQTLIYRGKKRVKADDDNNYDCLVFSFVEYDKKNKEHEVITFYISDDRNHLPIRLDLYLNFGCAKAFFKKVHGNRYPLQPVTD